MVPTVNNDPTEETRGLTARLGLVLAALGVLTAGGVVLTGSADTARNPWGEATITVTINNTADENDYEPLTRAAIKYWNDRFSELGYTGRFVYEPNATDSPDVIVRVVDDVSGGANGRAPVTDGVRTAATPTVIRIEWDGEQSTQKTLTHEFGHTLGLTHADHPRWEVMQTFNASTINWRYGIPWEQRELLVYTSHSAATAGFTDAERGAIDSAILFYNNGASGRLNRTVTLQPTANRSRADIEIRKVDQLPDNYGCDHAYRSYRRVKGSLRYQTYGIIRIDRGGDSAFYNYCVGNGLSAFLLEADGAAPPPQFDEQTGVQQRRRARNQS